MFPYRDYPIARKLTWMNILVSTATLVLACIGFISYDVLVYRQNVTDNLATQAQVIGANTVSSILFNDQSTAQNSLAPLSSAPSMIYAGIYTTDGRPFLAYSHSQVVPPLPLPAIPPGQTQISWFENGQIGLVRLIAFKDMPAEYVYVRADQHILNQRLTRYAETSLIVLLGSLLAALFVSSTFRRSVAEPLSGLAQLANTVTREKDYSVRAAAPGNRDEVASLITAFNEMLAQIQRRDSALQEAHNELEARVKERTAELQLAEDSLRQLSSRLMQMQDDERRHLARELHDSTGQVLVALIMNLGVATSGNQPMEPSVEKAIRTSLELAQQVTREVRTMSYLLHPPLLDEEGLDLALRWFVEGFAERSGIFVDLKLSPDLGRLPRELETAIFRIVQECLTNILRHSQSAWAGIELTRHGDEVTIEVRDTGKGMPDSNGNGEAPRAGVGIQGMRERVKRFGGRLDIKSSAGGTCVSAVLHIAPESLAAPEQDDQRAV